MNITDIELCASYWTIAGDTYPGAPSEISPFSLRERAEVAGRIGWRGMGLVVDDLLAAIAKEGIETVRSIFADNGIRHVELEFLIDWHLQGARRAASDAMFASMLDIASKLDIAKIKGGAGVFEEGSPDIPAMRDALVGLGERAAPFGVEIVIEFLPFSSVNTIENVLAISENLGVDNVGLLVDTWHINRMGCTAKDVARIPSHLIKAVELDDADAQIVESTFNDSTHHRKLCGAGVIDIIDQIQAIIDGGYRSYWGVELISAEQRKLPLETAARRAFETTMTQFEAIRFPADATA